MFLFHQFAGNTLKPLTCVKIVVNVQNKQFVLSTPSKNLGCHNLKTIMVLKCPELLYV